MTTPAQTRAPAARRPPPGQPLQQGPAGLRRQPGAEPPGPRTRRRPRAPSRPGAAPPALFLFSDTGGGHRAAAQAVAEGLAAVPGGRAVVLLDPLAGPQAPWLLRRVMRLYGPAIRHAPWAWAAAYRVTDSALAMAVLRRTLLRLADRPVQAAVAALGPAALVSFHPLTTGAAVRAAQRAPSRPPVATVVTDLVSVHSSWRQPGADRVVLPASAGRPGPAGAPPAAALGLPVGAQFAAGPLAPAARAKRRRELGLRPGRFVALVTGGAEGAGGLPWVVRALLREGGVDVVAICGRNDRLLRRLSRLAAGSGGRLTVTGFVTSMADWLRCADVVVTKPGPGTLAEAACCGSAMLLTSPAGGQEAGNAELVIRAGAGRCARHPAQLLQEIRRLRGDPAALDRMRAAAAGLARPGAAAAIAGLIAGLAAGHPAAAAPGQAPARQPAASGFPGGSTALPPPALPVITGGGPAGQGPGGLHHAGR